MKKDVRSTLLRSLTVIALVSAALCFTAQGAYAYPTLPYFTIDGTNVDFSYNSTSTLFTIAGKDTGSGGDNSIILYYDANNQVHAVSSGEMDINIDVAKGNYTSGNVGHSINANDLVINATSIAGTTYSGNVITGSLKSNGLQFTDYPSGQGPDIFNFSFSITGGTMASLFGGIGNTIGVEIYTDQVTGSNNVNGYFAGTYSNQVQTITDDVSSPVSATPIPGTLLLFAPGLAALVVPRLRHIVGG